jgi:hypothetical protein
MPYENTSTPVYTESTDSSSEKISKLLGEKKSGRIFQDRKHPDWDENYELYRNKVKTNRLTQRQAVNVPLMKETIKTILSGIDDPPTVTWKEKSGDQMKEIIYQELWNEFTKRCKWELVDLLDKKNVLLYGLSTKTLNVGKKGIDLYVRDVYDVIYDPLMNPLDIETARFIVHQNKFKTLREIIADPRYEQKGKDELKNFMLTPKGMVVSGQNKVEWEKKQVRLRAMGVQDTQFPLFAGGDVIVNITEHLTNLWDTKTQKFVRHVVVYADNQFELMDETLEELTGSTKWPDIYWTEDIETNDIYPDSVADLVRVPNKIINVWISQQIENRTLQNFQMHWYDATIQGYQPQTYEPGPGRMLPAPGDPNKTIMPVMINGLDETFQAIDFLTKIVERGTGATALDKGQPEQGEQTLGEVKILVGKAMERGKTLSKFYRNAAYDLAVKWDELMQANSFGSFKLYKTGRDGKVYEKTVYDKDWKSKAGYEPQVASSSEQEADDTKSVQKWQFVLQQYPNNTVLKRLSQKRQLGLLDLSPQELKEVEEEEKRMEKMAEQAATRPETAPAAPAAPNPAKPPQMGPMPGGEAPMLV